MPPTFCQWYGSLRLYPILRALKYISHSRAGTIYMYICSRPWTPPPPPPPTPPPLCGGGVGGGVVGWWVGVWFGVGLGLVGWFRVGSGLVCGGFRVGLGFGLI